MKNILVFFANADRSYAVKIKDFFMAEGMELVEENDSFFQFKTDKNVYKDSAIVLISDKATESNIWQRMVRNIPESYRLIPLGNTIDADYSNPNIIPNKIEEINSIRMDENCLKNIKESLATNPEIYNVKNNLKVMLSAYNASQCNPDYLMSDGKMIRDYWEMLSVAVESEGSGEIKAQLYSILQYLEASKSHARKLFIEDLIKKLKNGFWGLLAIIIVILAVYMSVTMKKLSTISSFIFYDVDQKMAPIRAAEAIDGLNTSITPDSVKYYLSYLLTEALEKNWSNSILASGNYKWGINDVSYAGDNNHLLTAEGSGKIVQWDVRSGQPTLKEQVSDSPLGALVVSKDNKLRLAIDSKGKVYYSFAYDSWDYTGYTCGIEWLSPFQIQLSADNQKVMVCNGKSVILLRLNNGSITELCKKEFSEIGDIGFDNLGNAHVLIKNGDMWEFLKIKDDGSEKITATNISVNITCSPDIREGVAALVDKNGQIIVLDINNNYKSDCTGLLLYNPISIAVSNQGYMLYLDRNTGVRIYDYKRKMDIGACLGMAFAADRLEIAGEMAVAFLDGKIISENIQCLLPSNHIEEKEIENVYEGQYASSSGLIKSIAVKNKYMIEMVMNLETEKIIIFDPAMKYFTGKAVKDEKLMEGMPKAYTYYSNLHIHFTGEPTLVGIVKNQDVIIIGGYDGSFYEVLFGEEGGAIIASSTQVPSHSPIVKVYQGKNKYYIEDSQGNIWQRRIGYKGMLNGDLLINEVKDKLRSTMSSDISQMISKKTMKLLGIKVAPDSNGKEWE